MGRRLSTLTGIALAFGLSVSLALAEPQAPPAPAELPAGGPLETPPPDPPSRPEPLEPLEPPIEAKGGPAPAMPAPEALPPVPETEAPVSGEKAPTDARLDMQLRQAQIPIKSPAGPKRLAAAVTDTGPLPPAGVAPGQTAPVGAPAAVQEGDSFVLPPDRLPLGKQALGLSVDVIAPSVLNINQAATLKIVVKNTGQTDAMGVVVRDELPPNLTFLASQPEAQRIDTLLTWKLGTVAAGSERLISVRVKPTKVGSFDHAATVTMLAGGKSRTRVQEPKLKVEQSVSSAKVLKGQTVEFKITISNPGDGPARNVTIQAKLTTGLKHESGEPNDQNLFEQTIDLIEPGQSLVLEPLVADTIQAGEQTCVVEVHSPDVTPGAPEARSLQAVTIIEPMLKLSVSGPAKRYAETVAPYVLTVENPGSATAKNVNVIATLQVGGRLAALPSGARYDRYKRELSWSLGPIEPGAKASLSFQVRMGGIGLYQVTAQAKADGSLFDKASFSTDVTGLADVNFEVSERKRVIDIDDETIFRIKVTNYGTKEASHLLVTANMSENLHVVETRGTEEHANQRVEDRLIVFPQIERLAAGKEMTLEIKVKAMKSGVGTCRVFLMHDDMTEKIDDVAHVNVTAIRR
jgi:uncharacterized repeat protein (TIGR01451 family)